MKRNFKIVMSFFGNYDGVIRTKWESTDGYDLSFYDSDVSLPNNIVNVIEEIIRDDWQALIYVTESELGEYRIIRVDISPKTKLITVTCEIQDNVEDYETYEGEFEDESVVEYMENNNIENITALYYGGGDDGTIEEFEVNGEPIKNTDPNFDFVEELTYQQLEKHYTGWEIDGGSTGNITITKDGIMINHTWTYTEMVDSGYERIIDENSISDEK